MRFKIGILAVLCFTLMFASTAMADTTKTYSDGEWGFTVDYPSYLQVYNEGDGSVSFLDADGIEVVRVDCYYDEATRSYDPLGGAVEGIYEILNDTYSDWNSLSEEYDETWQGYSAGELWYSSFDGDFWWQECDYIIFADDAVYLVSMIWPEDDMADYWEDFYTLVYSFETF